jgi:hypothetical protein
MCLKRGAMEFEISVFLETAALTGDGDGHNDPFEPWRRRI